ncbi:MAG: MFS transporter [Alistipes sp.]|nr:MFS transporter [Alistipes sp.]
MTQTIRKNLNDHAWARWSAMLFIALMMLFAHMFVDVISPLKELIQLQRGWTSDVFGTYAGSEYLLNVWGFLIVAGIILDKMGIRFTGELSAIIMLAGACIKYYAISDAFAGTALETWLNSWWVAMPGSAKLASLGFMIFGCGCEMAGITASKALAKWFEGKEMALAMGLEMALARVGVFFIFTISPRIAGIGGADPSVVRPVAFCTALLCIGLLCYTIFCLMDKKLDKQLGATTTSEPEEEFKISDIGKIFSSRLFWIVAMLCVLYYSAIFPFQKFAANMLQSNLGISATAASDIFRWFPIGAAFITPFLGWFLNRKGKGATMLILGSILMIVCHTTFALVLPAVPSKAIAFAAIIVLGISFSLVPAALWPSIPKIMDKRYLGSAYSLIFWVQNFGLSGTPIIIGYALEKTNPGVAEQIAAGAEGVAYNYTVPMLLFASLGVLALLFALWLKADDARNHYGLEEPNIKK